MLVGNKEVWMRGQARRHRVWWWMAISPGNGRHISRGYPAADQSENAGKFRKVTEAESPFLCFLFPSFQLSAVAEAVEQRLRYF